MHIPGYILCGPGPGTLSFCRGEFPNEFNRIVFERKGSVNQKNLKDGRFFVVFSRLKVYYSCN